MRETWKNDSNAKNTNMQAARTYLIKYLRNFWKNLDWIGTRERDIKRQKKIENNNKISGILCVPANKTLMYGTICQTKLSSHSSHSHIIGLHKEIHFSTAIPRFKARIWKKYPECVFLSLLHANNVFVASPMPYEWKLPRNHLQIRMTKTSTTFDFTALFDTGKMSIWSALANKIISRSLTSQLYLLYYSFATYFLRFQKCLPNTAFLLPSTNLSNNTGYPFTVGLMCIRNTYQLADT